MKKVVNFDSISKKELYDLYLQQCEKIEKAEAKIYALEMELAEKIKRLEEANFVIANRNKYLFGKKRENNKNNINHFNEAENHAARSTVKKNKIDRQEKNREFLEKNYTEVINLEPEEIKTRKDLIKIGEDITFKIETTPARLKIIKVISSKYVDHRTNQIFQKVKDDSFSHSFCTSSFAAEILSNKFILGVPYYRQSKYLFDDGLCISRQNLCNYQLKTSEIIKPMYNYLIQKLKETSVKVLHADETTLRVLDVAKSKCYVWLFNSSYYEKPIFIYLFDTTRSSNVPKQFLNDYSGYLISDCYSGYNEIPNVKNSYCWVHARRKFIEILDNLPTELKETSKSQLIVNEIDKMFALEKRFRKKKLTATEILKERNGGEFKKHLDQVFKLLSETNPKPSSPLEDAINYILKRKESFLEILNDGHLDLSNNSAERGVKPFVIARKNFLFANTTSGAQSSTIIFSILQTAIANGVDHKKYIKKLIEEIGINPSTEKLESLLPWKIKI